MATTDENAPLGEPLAEAPWYAGAAGWEPLSRAFIGAELGTPDPDYGSLAARLANYSAEERHAAWIRVAQEAPSRMGRTRAYVEALHNDADLTSVAWSWLDGGLDQMGKVEHVIGPRDARTMATVDAVRRRLGSIVEFGGRDLDDGPDAGDGEKAVGPETDPEAAKGQPVADEPVVEEQPLADELVVEEQPVAQPQPVDDEPAADEPAEEPQPAPWQPAPVQAAPWQPAVPMQPAAIPMWSPTHFVPAGGLPAWDHPDPTRQPTVDLSAGLGVVIDSVLGDWAFVRAMNGWRGWVDARRLIRSD